MRQRTRISSPRSVSCSLLLPPLLLAAALLPACSKARQQAQPGETEPKTEAPTALERPPSKPPVAAEPEDIVSEQQVQTLQRQLVELGYEVPRSGKLDEPTRQALRRFQKNHGLAETGMPDLATLRLLGLEPYTVYGRLAPRARPAAEREPPAEPGEQHQQDRKDLQNREDDLEGREPPAGGQPGR